MKIFVTTLFFSSLMFAYFSSCRKGEDDPFFSMRTRKARLVGDWAVTEETGSSKFINNTPMSPISNSVQTFYSFQGSIKTGYSINSSTHFTTIDCNSVTQTVTQTELTPQYYTENYSFLKDKTFQFSHLNNDGSFIKYGGEWTFKRKGELRDEKEKLSYYTSTSIPYDKVRNKEVLELTITNYSSLDSNGTSTSEIPFYFEKNQYYDLKELRNNEIKLVYTNSDKGAPNHGTSDYYNSKKTTTLKLK